MASKSGHSEKRTRQEEVDSSLPEDKDVAKNDKGPLPPLPQWKKATDEFETYVSLAKKLLAENRVMEVGPLIAYFNSASENLLNLFKRVKNSLPHKEIMVGEHVIRMIPSVSNKIAYKLQNLKDHNVRSELTLSPIEYTPAAKLRESWAPDWDPPPFFAERADRDASRPQEMPWFELPVLPAPRHPLDSMTSQHGGSMPTWRNRSEIPERRGYPGAEDEEDELLQEELRRYVELPTPWNTVPTFTPKRHLFDIGRYVSTSGERKFYGDPEKYPRWRTEFIANLGSVKCLARIKVSALVIALSPILDTLTSKDSLDFDGYKEIVTSLEEKYGESYMQTRKYEKYFEQEDVVQYGVLSQFEEYKIKAEKFINLLRNSKGKSLPPSEYVYEKLLNPLAPGYIEEYNTWIIAANKCESFKTLEEWLTVRIKRLRRYPVRSTKVEIKRTKSCLCVRETIQSSPQSREPDSEEIIEESGDRFEDDEIEETCTLLKRARIPPFEGCPIACEELHDLDVCPRFLSLSPMRRLVFLRNWKAPICFRCLKENHMANKCTEKNLCEKCNKEHHTLLHSPGIKNERTTVLNLKLPEQLPITNNPIIKIGISNPERSKIIEIAGLIDTGSTITVVKEDLANRLNLRGEELWIKLQTARGPCRQKAEMVEIYIHSRSTGSKWKVPVLVFKESDLFDGLGVETSLLQAEEWPHLRKLPLIPNNLADLEVALLLGNDLSFLTAVRASVVGKGIQEPIAEKSLLGWSIRGPNASYEKTALCMEGGPIMPESAFREMQEFLKQLERSWNMELISFPFPPITEADREATEMLKNNVTLEQGRLKASILWKGKKRPKVPNNRPMALHRYRILKKYLKRTPEIETAYTKNIAEWIETGKLIKAKSAEEGTINYLCHFPVIRLDKDTTKVRTVVDAAAKYNGVSINDYIHPGPKLSNDVFPVLLRFRREKYAIMGDVKNMFLQIQLCEEDQSYHRLLWNEGEELQEYQFTVFTFGNTCSPAVAIRAAQLLGELASPESEYSRAKEALFASTVMDDTVDSVSSEEEAVSLLKALRKIYASGGMDFRKLVANFENLNRHFHPSLLRLENTVSFDASIENSMLKTLGMLWKPIQDTLQYDLKFESDNTLTRRHMLSQVAKVYDPLGLISPLLIRFKMLIQQTWDLGIGWDAALPIDINKQWIKLKNETQGTIVLPIMRALTNAPLSNTKRQLHIFTDASSEGYGTAAYLVSEYPNHRTAVLVCAKAKVAPLRYTTIPRLELQGALEAANLVDTLLSTLKLTPDDVYFWTDSTDVLQWLTMTSRKLKVFVANRVSAIQSKTWVSRWDWVETKENPADILSRGTSKAALLRSSLWWHGPEFLLCPEKRRRRENTENPNPSIKEIRKRKPILIQVRRQENDFKTRIENITNSWNKLIRIIAVVLKWRPSRRDIDNRPEAERSLFRLIQREEWEEEIEILQKQTLGINHPLAQYRPFLDWSSILRLRGRLSHIEDLPWATRFPIILPRTRLVGNLIMYIHTAELKHMGGLRTLQAKIASRIFIPQGRNLIKRVLRNCIICRKSNAQSGLPAWAPLPPSRVPTQRVEVFSNTAMDIMGPFLITETGMQMIPEVVPETHPRGRGRPRTKEDVPTQIPTEIKKKMYILVLTCMNFRATHLEIVENLSTDELILALERFLTFREKPNYVLTDNGTNFVGGKGLLLPLWERLENSGKERWPATQWHFTVPGAAHTNGVVERIVGLTKIALSKALRNKKIYGSEFRTVVVMAAGALNNRPLQDLGGDDEDESVLTPNHFLRGNAYSTLLPREAEWTLIKTWTKANEIMKIFWTRFLKEVVPTYNFRNLNHRGKARNWRKNEIVLVKDSANVGKDIAFPTWPLGRIIETYPGSDGVIRSVKIRMRGQEYVRNISFIAPLEAE